MVLDFFQGQHGVGERVFDVGVVTDVDVVGLIDKDRNM